MEPFLVQNTVPLTSFCLVVSACSLIHSFKIGVLSVFPWLSQNFADGCLTVEIACYVSDIQLLLSGVFMYTSVIYQLFPACLIAHKSPLSWHVSVLSSVKGQIFLTFLFPIWFLKRSIGIFSSWLCCKSSFPFFSQLDTLPGVDYLRFIQENFLFHSSVWIAVWELGKTVLQTMLIWHWERSEGVRVKRKRWGSKPY